MTRFYSYERNAAYFLTIHISSHLNATAACADEEAIGIRTHISRRRTTSSEGARTTSAHTRRIRVVAAASAKSTTPTTIRLPHRISAIGRTLQKRPLHTPPRPIRASDHTLATRTRRLAPPLLPHMQISALEARSARLRTTISTRTSRIHRPRRRASVAARTVPKRPHLRTPTTTRRRLPIRER